MYKYKATTCVYNLGHLYFFLKKLHFYHIIFHSTLANIFNLEDYDEDLKSGIVVDLYYYTIQFARDNDFTKEQTSALFSIVKKTHEVCIGNI